MLDLDRMACLVALALSLAACSTPPGQVASSGHTPGDTGDSGSSTTAGSGPTTNASATVASADGTSSTTDDPATTTPLDDSGTSSSTTTDPSATDTSGSSGDPTTMGMETTTGEMDVCHPKLVEVQYDPKMGDNDKQWVKLFNPCSENIDLADYSLQWSDADDLLSAMDLSGMMPADDCFIVGGPNSVPENENPMIDLPIDFNPDIDKGSSPGNRVALFFDSAANIMPNTVPVDAVIYGDDNNDMLLDADNMVPAAAHVGDAPSESSLRRTSEMITWIIEAKPMPNVCPPQFP